MTQNLPKILIFISTDQFTSSHNGKAIIKETRRNMVVKMTEIAAAEYAIRTNSIFLAGLDL